MLVREFWKIPFLRLILPFLGGIVFADYFNIDKYFWFSFFIVSVAFAFIYRPFLDHSLSYHRRWIFGLIITFGLFNLGAFVTKKSKQFDNGIPGSQMLIGIINNSPKATPYSIKTEFKVNAYKKDNVWYNSSEKIILTFEKDSNAGKLQYGDLILIKGNLDEIKNAGNPSEFDYKKYLARKHIYFRGYQNSKQWSLLDKQKGNPLFQMAFNLRDKLLGIYQQFGIKGEEFGLLAALTLGTTDYLSDEIIEAYSESGAMHVLSVSGLHVGVIFIVLNHLLFFLNKKRYLQILQAILIIVAIWFFALLTGLSPSVNRASAMITFVILGRVSNKKPSTYNSIAASAFFLLFINPLLIYDVGFQLSYLAVISLIFFYQRIYNLIEPRYWILDKIWSLTVVSIAAQIGTTALSVFYFHQFPVYALISNLIVVPLSSLILIFAIALLALSFIVPLAKVIAILLNYTIIFTNGITKFIEDLPFSTIEPVSLNSTESLFIHVALILIFIYIVTKNKRFAYPILAALIISFGLRDYRFVKQNQTQTFTVYNSTRKSAFSIIENGNLTLFSDSALYNDQKSINYLTSNILANDFIEGLELQKLETNSNKNNKNTRLNMIKYSVGLDSLKIIYLNGDYSRFKSKNKLDVDFMVLSKYAPMDLTVIENLFSFDLLIADASVPKWKQEVLKRDCLQAGIPFYNVSEMGAFVHQIRK